MSVQTSLHSAHQQSAEWITEWGNSNLTFRGVEGVNDGISSRTAARNPWSQHISYCHLDDGPLLWEQFRELHLAAWSWRCIQTLDEPGRAALVTLGTSLAL